MLCSLNRNNLCSAVREELQASCWRSADQNSSSWTSWSWKVQFYQLCPECPTWQNVHTGIGRWHLWLQFHQKGMNICSDWGGNHHKFRRTVVVKCTFKEHVHHVRLQFQWFCSSHVSVINERNKNYFVTKNLHEVWFNNEFIIGLLKMWPNLLG